MNKRIKKKHVAKQNKDLMTSTLKYLKTLGLHPFNIEYPKGYFFSENRYPYEIMHFQLREIPEFLFGVWYKTFELEQYKETSIALEMLKEVPNKEILELEEPTKKAKLPIIFGERLCVLDKFKPSRTEWTPMYDKFVYGDSEFKMSDYWSTLQTLTAFVKTPWDYIPYETEKEYKETLEKDKLEKRYRKEVLQTVCSKVEEKFKEFEIPFGILSKEKYWCHQNLYLIFDENKSQEQIEKKFNKMYNFINFDLNELVKDIITSLKYEDYVYSYQDEFNWHLNKYWLIPKDELEKTKSMNFMELNKEFDNMNLNGSKFIRLSGE